MVYLEVGQLSAYEGRWCLDLETPASQVDLQSGEWGEKADRVVFDILEVEADDEIKAAQKLHRVEGRLFEHLRLDTESYTLLTLQEEGSESGRGYKRSVRFAVVRGAWGASRLEGLTAQVDRKAPRSGGKYMNKLPDYEEM